MLLNGLLTQGKKKHTRPEGLGMFLLTLSILLTSLNSEHNASTFLWNLEFDDPLIEFRCSELSKIGAFWVEFWSIACSSTRKLVIWFHLM